MSKETEAIKAVALVAEQAYREVFHVDDTATTTELNVLADAVAALDKPTPAPEPPKFTKASRIGYQINGVPFPPDPTSRPEASQPESILPVAVLASVDGLERDIMRDIVDCDDEDRAEAARMFSGFKQRLAVLWPKAGQVPSVTVRDCMDWLDADANCLEQERQMKALRMHAFVLSRTVQPAVTVPSIVSPSPASRIEEQPKIVKNGTYTNICTVCHGPIDDEVVSIGSRMAHVACVVNVVGRQRLVDILGTDQPSPLKGDQSLTRGRTIQEIEAENAALREANDRQADSLELMEDSVKDLEAKLGQPSPVTAEKLAEQAYREVFHVDDTATTTELNVLADAVAALDKPTPAPEPPKAGTHGMCSCGHAGAFHHPGDGHCWICRCRQYDGTPSMPPQPHFPGQPEARQPDALPAEVEAAIEWILAHRGENSEITRPDLEHWFQRIAALWPKAGQMPSKAELQVWLTKHSDSGIPMEDGENLHKWLLSRVGQPSPVTAEKLAEQIRTIPNPWSGDVDLFQNIRLATRQGFEECREAVLKLVRSQGLAQPALTREQVATVFENEFPSYSQGYRSRVVDDILALQGPVTVSKEQWDDLHSLIMDGDVDGIKAWLKEIGVEVTE